MEQLSKEELIEAYQKAYDAIPQEALELDFRVTVKTIQALAEGQPVSPHQLAEIWKLPLEQVRMILDQAVTGGQAVVDDQGDLVGGVLSLVPTAHRVSVDDEQLYAWCAYDAIYAPGVVGKPFQVESQDPVTGDPIKMTITPAGVEAVEPEGTVVTVVGPEADMRGGPESPRCNHMLFFASRQSAEKWRQDRPGVSILTVAEVFEIARQLQIETARSLGLV